MTSKEKTNFTYLMIPIGSAGDVHPFVGLGQALKNRGHRVVLLTNPYFKQLVELAGLEFVALGTIAEFETIKQDPDLWDPHRGFECVFRGGVLPVIQPVYQFIADRYVQGKTRVVASALAFGARIAQDKWGIPLVTLDLQPSMFRSAYASPVLPMLSMGPSWPRWVKRAIYRLVDVVVDRLIAQDVNAFRKKVSLPPVHRLLDQWWHSPQRVIGLFPDWFAIPQPDWPSQARLTQFPLYDAAGIEEVPATLKMFLKSGPAPVLFTAGSAMCQGDWFFKESVEACRRLRIRGVLLTEFSGQLPRDLPPEVMHVRYAPFSALFPRASAVVHHGGIGTTAQALASGVPQLVVPLAHDQPDNAARLNRLGVSITLSPQEYKADALVKCLVRLRTDPSFKSCAQDVARRFEGIDPLSQTCDWLEEPVPGHS